MRLCLVKTLDLHQVSENLFCNLVYKVCIDGVDLTLLIYSHDAAVNIVSHRFVVLFLCDISLFFHIIKNDIASFLVVVRMGDRVISRGI